MGPGAPLISPVHQGLFGLNPALAGTYTPLGLKVLLTTKCTPAPHVCYRAEFDAVDQSERAYTFGGLPEKVGSSLPTFHSHSRSSEVTDQSKTGDFLLVVRSNCGLSRTANLFQKMQNFYTACI